jgi:hypothetical protein
MPSNASRDIPLPSEDRVPLKTNVFDFIQNSVSTLSPLFPYTDENSIVPCAAAFRGAPGRRFGRFQHFNTVDELAVFFGVQGGERRGTAGMVHVGPKLHLVQAPLDDPEDTEAVRVVVITQRQLRDKSQREEMRFICDKCEWMLCKFSLDEMPAKRGASRNATGQMPAFISVRLSYESALAFNSDEKLRLCGRCGYANPPFPIEAWGWDHYAEQTDIANVGRQSLGHTHG